MYTNVVRLIEKEYESKRNLAERDYKLQKENIYTKNPKLASIDLEIKKLGIKSAKAALTMHDNRELLSDLESKISELKKEKETILEKLSFSSMPNYECKKCNDTGYIMTDTGSHMCNCFKQKLINESYNSSNLNNLKNETFEKFNLNLYSSEVSLEKYNSNISPKDNMNKIKDICLNFVNEFGKENQKNLLFTGGPGLGKTFLSSCIANEILKKGKTVLYQTAPLLFDSIFNYKYNKAQDTSNNLYNNLFTVDLLIIDDLGTENLSDAKFSELFTILNARMLSSKTKTIISTNLSLQSIASSYDLRIISRIIGNYDTCRFYGEDIRLKK